VAIVTEIKALRWKIPSSISGRDKDFLFSQTSKLVLEQTQPSTEMYRGIFFVFKAARRKAINLRPSTAEAAGNN
jgi:hypothetical protein